MFLHETAFFSMSRRIRKINFINDIFRGNRWAMEAFITRSEKIVDLVN